MSAEALWQWLVDTPVAAFVREAAWAYPLLETVHILGLALVVGPILAFDLRLLGWHRDLAVDRLAAYLLPLVMTGIVGNLVSGGLLFASDAVEFAANPALQVKLALIVVAVLNALWFQSRVFPDHYAWRQGTPAPPAARVAAAVSIAVWLLVLTAGRMMAYVK
ncbi:MAG: hypothetical protein AB1749_16010 [Pseudomonadota bacterium]